MGPVYWLLTCLLLCGQSNARPFYDDADFSNARFLDALLYEKTETLKAAISLLSQLNLPLLCQSVAADPHAKFATVADLLHFATVVVQSQENMTSNLEDQEQYSTLPTEMPFEKITSVYPKAVTETVSVDIDPSTRPAFPNLEMTENDFKPIEELDKKNDVNGKLLDKQQLVINSHDSINGENRFESESRLMKNKTSVPQGKTTPENKTKSSSTKPSPRQTQRMSFSTTKIETTETPKKETFPVTTGASTYVTLESENSFTELPETQRPKRPDQSYYGRSDQQPSQPTSSHSRPGLTTPLHWLIREKWPQIEKSTQELRKGGKILSEELSREILIQIESDNVTIRNQTEEDITTREHEMTNTTSKPTIGQHKHSSNSTTIKMTTVTKQTKPTKTQRNTKVTSRKSTRISNRKTTSSFRDNKIKNNTISVTAVSTPITTSRSPVTPRKSPYLTTKPVAKTSSQAPKTRGTVTSKVSHSTANTSEIIRFNETKQNETNSKSSHSKSIKPVFTTINITQILEYTKTSSPAQRRTHTATTRMSNVPSTKVTLNGLTMTTSLNTSMVPANQTAPNNINTTAVPINETPTTTFSTKSPSQSTKFSDNVTSTTTMSRTNSKLDSKPTSSESLTRNITKITTKHLPRNISTTVSKSTTTETTSAEKSTTTTPKKSTTQRSTHKPIAVLQHDNALENSVKDTESQQPSLREKIVPVQISRDTDRSDLGDYGNEIPKEETKDYVAPGQNDDDNFGFFTCPTIFGFYPDAINCGQFYICSWSIPYHFDCPVGTVWNTELTVCDWPFNVNCGTRPWFGQTAFEKHFLPSQL